MQKAYLISTGTELLMGATTDTNSVFLAQKLEEIGIRVIGKSTVGDNEESITNAFESGIKMADIVISTGGLGPTNDDLTKQVACKVMNCQLELINEELENLKNFFSRRNRHMTENNLKQAMFPRECVILKNSLGTAPGMYLDKDQKLIILLPGPPREMKKMYLEEVEGRLKEKFNLNRDRAAIRTIKVLGPGESQVEALIADIVEESQGCSLALLAMDGEIHIKITAEGEDQAHSKEMIDELTSRITERLNHNIIGYDEDSIVSRIEELLVNQGKKLAVAESCTGGLLSKMITDLPGSSRYFWGSVVSYSNEAKKVLLQVEPGVLDTYGAVSRETAVEMAFNVLKVSGADVSLAITGIAGPDGGTPEKPVGLVYIAAADAQNCMAKEMRFVGDREAIRILSAKTALDLLRRYFVSGVVKE